MLCRTIRAALVSGVPVRSRRRRLSQPYRCFRRHGSSADGAPVALVFDTETTGKVDFQRPATHPNQPHLVQLGMILVDTSDWSHRMQTSFLVQLTKGVSIEPGAQDTHGISADDCDRFGVSPSVAVQLFHNVCQQADVLVAHNLAFDVKVMEAALHRQVGITAENLQGTIKDKPRRVCTMQLCTDILKLPGKYGNQYKWPSLQEAYAHFSSTDAVLEGAHDALADAEACLTVFRGLVDSGALQLADCGTAQEDGATSREDPLEDVSTKAKKMGKIDKMATGNVGTTVSSTANIPGSSRCTQRSPMPSMESIARPGELWIHLEYEGFKVTGQTFKYKEYLKSLGAKWDGFDKVWRFKDHAMLGPVKRLAGISVVDDAAEEAMAVYCLKNEIDPNVPLHEAND